MTDITKIVITATDQASEVFTKVQGSAERLQGVYAKLAAAFTGAVGVGYFVHLIKGAIDAAEAIDKLSQKTGISVQQLSQLEYIMKLQGVTTESFGKGMKTLAERMVETTDATSKSHQLMKMLGVDVAAGPNKAIDQLAGVFSKLNDGATKTTLAVYLFGKTGMDMIPVLNQGPRGNREAPPRGRAPGRGVRAGLRARGVRVQRQHEGDEGLVRGPRHLDRQQRAAGTRTDLRGHEGGGDPGGHREGAACRLRRRPL
jgi:hypothetical protein